MIRDRQIVLSWNRDSDPSFLRSREWLVTNHSRLRRNAGSLSRFQLSTICRSRIMRVPHE